VLKAKARDEAKKEANRKRNNSQHYKLSENHEGGRSAEICGEQGNDRSVQNDGYDVIHYTFTEYTAVQFGLLTVVDDADSCHHVRTAQEGSEQQSLQGRHLDLRFSVFSAAVFVVVSHCDTRLDDCYATHAVNDETKNGRSEAENADVAQILEKLFAVHRVP